jgi:hypothetical protein
MVHTSGLDKFVEDGLPVVATVDGSQGQEAAALIISMVIGEAASNHVSRRETPLRHAEPHATPSRDSCLAITKRICSAASSFSPELPDCHLHSEESNYSQDTHMIWW